MITLGMDMGAKFIKIVMLRDGEIVSRVKRLSGFEQEVTANETFTAVLKETGVKHDAIDCIVATGAGRKVAPFASDTVTDVGAAARGAISRHEGTRFVLDVGAEEGRAILVSPNGRAKDFVVNEKCAAGSGTFIESMSRALEVNLEEFGRLSLNSQRAVPMNAQCAVFAESEVVSLLHARTPKEDIIRAVHDAIANRIVSMARRLSIQQDVMVVGGMAYNIGFIDALKRTIETDIIVAENPDFVPAEGAAWVAWERVSQPSAIAVGQ
jgi:benzoyl-CoA reductase subunit D